MATSEPSDKDQIYVLTRECKERFQLIFSSIDPGPCHDFINSQHKSFRAWIATIGALAPPQASLDHRLREHGHIKLAVVELLHLLKDCLGTEPCQAESGSEKDEGDKSTAKKPQALISQHMALEKALESLHELASSIRRASAPNSNFDLSARFSRGDKIYDSNFENFAKLFVKYRFPSASKSLCDHISTAMSHRRNWLVYNYRHSQKLRQDHKRGLLSTAGQPTSIHDPTGPSQSGASATPFSSTQPNQPPSAVFQKRVSPPTYSDTVGSRLSARNMFKIMQTRSSIGSVRTGVLLRNDMHDYPPIPKFDQDDEFCDCPYCFKPLATEKLTKSFWRRHYDDDTRPFVCLSEECDDPPRLFSRFDFWERHMVEQHSRNWAQIIHSTVWYCDIDECRSSEQTFDLRRNFEEHIWSKPKCNYSATQVSALVVRKQRKALRDALTCPLCEVKVETHSEGIPSLAVHVGGHLHYLAGICVPQREQSAEEVNSDSQSSGKKTERDSHTDLKAEWLTDAEKSKPLFQDEDRVPELGESAAETFYMSPKGVEAPRTVDRLYFMIHDYNPLQDAILQDIASHSQFPTKPGMAHPRIPHGHQAMWQQSKVPYMGTQTSGREIVHLLSQIPPNEGNGSRSTKGEKEEDSNTEEPWPYFRRYWKRPGMGASIGLENCQGVSATSGCYIDVDHVTYMLTANLSIKRSPDAVEDDTSDIATIVSPALSDVDNMRKMFKLTRLDLEKQITSMWSSYSDTDLKANGLISQSHEYQDMLDRIDRITEELRLLSQPEDMFRLGTVKHRSNRDEDISSRDSGSINLRPRLDWALCQVLPDRKGENRHRFLYAKGRNEIDFSSGDTDGLGAGEGIQSIGSVQSGDLVYFVGQASGLWHGIANPAPDLLCADGVESSEWAIRPTPEPWDDQKILRDDLGAAVIHCSDRTIVGLLWGGDGLLLYFTPIQAIIKDIKRVTGSNNVNLTPIQTD